MLRSCYSTKMCFGTDTSVTARIKWYFCSPAALPLGIPTPFCSRNYADKGLNLPIGEVMGAPRPWRDGSFPIVVDGTSGPCGDPGVWMNGYPGPNPPGLARSDIGLAWCCAQPGLQAGQPLIQFWPSIKVGVGIYWGKDFFGPDYYGADYWG